MRHKYHISPEAYSEICQASKEDLLAKIVFNYFFKKPHLEGSLKFINDTQREKFNSVQEFVKIKLQHLLIFLECLHNQLIPSRYHYKVLEFN